MVKRAWAVAAIAMLSVATKDVRVAQAQRIDLQAAVQMPLAASSSAAVKVGVLALAAQTPTPFPISMEPPEKAVRPTSVSMVDGVLTIDEDGPQVKDDLFDGTEKFAAKAKESNEVNLDKSMLGLAAGKGGAKGDLARKMDFIVVRSYEFANEGDYKMADVTDYFKKLDATGWKHLVRTKSAKESTDICVKQDAEGAIREMVIISAEPKELSFVHLKGNLSVGDLNRLGGVIGGAGASAAAQLQQYEH